ncbi:hypothetical protein J4441_02515 [Candidatus Micrarchaeota archaeon]|nr:hypothetical protein [Candidatus Micrarchaeota archaeon]
MASVNAGAQHAHNVFGIRHLEPIHHPDHPQHRKNNFDRLYGQADREHMHAKMSRREMLSPIESLHRILEGNRVHSRRVEKFLLEGKMPAEIKCLLLICADARMGGMFRFDDFAKEGIVPVYVAGNVAEVFKNDRMKELLGKLAEKSSIIIMGHSKCGAVHCANEKENFSSDKHRNIHGLLECVHHEEEGNVREQARKLNASKELANARKGKEISVACAFADIVGKTPSIEIRGRAWEAEKSFISRLSAQFEEANRGQVLSESQYAHAVVISDPSCGFDAREIANCGANEIFCISAASSADNAKAVASAEMALAGMLDVHMIASAEYSITHNSTRHIVVVHEEFEKIEAQIIRDSEIIRDAVISGTVEITAMGYNTKTGLLSPLRHLVNQDAAGIAAP